MHVIVLSGELALQEAMDLSQEGLPVIDEGIRKPKALRFQC
jgi:hypothetical protein